jgi:hypothetical protein
MGLKDAFTPIRVRRGVIFGQRNNSASGVRNAKGPKFCKCPTSPSGDEPYFWKFILQNGEVGNAFIAWNDDLQVTDIHLEQQRLETFAKVGRAGKSYDHYG